MFYPIKTYFANLAAPKLPSVDAFNYDQFWPQDFRRVCIEVLEIDEATFQIWYR